MIALWNKVIQPLFGTIVETRILEIYAGYGASTAKKMRRKLAMGLQQVQRELDESRGRELGLDRKLRQLREG